MSRRQRPLRRLANLRAARRRRQSHVPPARLPAPDPIPTDIASLLELPERFADSLEAVASGFAIRA